MIEGEAYGLRAFAHGIIQDVRPGDKKARQIDKPAIAYRTELNTEAQNLNRVGGDFGESKYRFDKSFGVDER